MRHTLTMQRFLFGFAVFNGSERCGIAYSFALELTKRESAALSRAGLSSHRAPFLLPTGVSFLVQTRDSPAVVTAVTEAAPFARSTVPTATHPGSGHAGDRLPLFRRILKKVLNAFGVLLT